MIGVFIIPTGLGARIGGDAGDATPAAKLLAECCDKLVIHPNVVNASDINEMTSNMLYVEGSMLDQFLAGLIDLRPVRTANKVLVVANPPLTPETINAVAAARATIGIEAEILELSVPLEMKAVLTPGLATGEVTGVDALVSDVDGRDFNALAIHTPIDVPREIALAYFRDGGINPWGGVEAKASRLIAERVRKPVAHAPLENVSRSDAELYYVADRVVKPSQAAEAISMCYLHCVLKGLHRAPRVGPGLSCRDVDVLITPFGCWGRPHEACRDQGIPIISVRQNPVASPVSMPPHIEADTYLEAAGLVMAMRAGVSPLSVISSLPPTEIIGE